LNQKKTTIQSSQNHDHLDCLDHLAHPPPISQLRHYVITSLASPLAVAGSSKYLGSASFRQAQCRLRRATLPVPYTDAGRYLFCVIIQFPDKNGYPVTARPMTGAERRRFQKWQRK
jgi:hypothetical protein